MSALPPGRLNLNDATKEEIQTVVSEHLAARIVFARKSDPFATWVDLIERVSYMTPPKVISIQKC